MHKAAQDTRKEFRDLLYKCWSGHERPICIARQLINSRLCTQFVAQSSLRCKCFCYLVPLGDAEITFKKDFCKKGRAFGYLMFYISTFCDDGPHIRI